MNRDSAIPRQAEPVPPSDLRGLGPGFSPIAVSSTPRPVWGSEVGSDETAPATAFDALTWIVVGPLVKDAPACTALNRR